MSSQLCKDRSVRPLVVRRLSCRSSVWPEARHMITPPDESTVLNHNDQLFELRSSQRKSGYQTGSVERLFPQQAKVTGRDAKGYADLVH